MRWKVCSIAATNLIFLEVCSIIILKYGKSKKGVILMTNINKDLKSRDFYLNKLIAFQDTEPVKIITGIRRCGKSSLMKLMMKHILDSGISEDQIIARV